VDPLLTVLTLYPLLAINICFIASINVNLLAKIAELVVLVSIPTFFAEPEKLSIGKLPSGPEIVHVAVALISTEPVGAYSQPPLGQWVFDRLVRVDHDWGM
jgi:hypothetical protein